MDCSRCGKCCHYIVPISEEEERILTVLLGGKLKMEARGEWDCRGGCPFLGEKRCMIYDQRPYHCRVYTCRMERTPDYEGMIAEGVAWGRAHGWRV